MKQALCIGAFAALASGTALAQTTTAPKMIVAISVDQFSADLFAEYRPMFHEGLRRIQAGAVFPSGYQSHSATETCPGHSTILTGSHPARTGIIANDWFDQSLARADKRVYCTEDPGVAGSSSSNYTVSAQFLLAKTLGDRMKAANPQSRVVAVAGKDRAAVMMGGHNIDDVWFWGGKSFVTLTDHDRPVPATVADANKAVAALMTKRYSPMLPDACRSRAAQVPVAGKTVGGLHDREAGDFSGLRASLEFDRVVTDMAIGMIRERKLGTGPAPDLLAIGLSATDYVGHAFGTEGAEMCAQVLGVDENVGRILKALDETHVPYALVLTADHGGHDLPERNQQRAIPDAVRVDPGLAPSAMGKALAGEFHLNSAVLVGASPFGDIYLARDLADDVRPKILEAARAGYATHPQVAAVFTAAEILATPVPVGPVDEWTLKERFRVNFVPGRSGDLLVALKPHVTPIADPRGYVATHGSPWNYDRLVPIVFYLPGHEGFEQPLPIETVDIMPTLAALIGLGVPANEIDGRCLDLEPGPADSCKVQ